MARNVTGPPNLDRMEPMRSQHGPRVVNRHHGDNFPPEGTHVLDHFEAAGKGWSGSCEREHYAASVGAIVSM